MDQRGISNWSQLCINLFFTLAVHSGASNIFLLNLRGFYTSRLVHDVFALGNVPVSYVLREFSPAVRALCIMIIIRSWRRRQIRNLSSLSFDLFHLLHILQSFLELLVLGFPLWIFLRFGFFYRFLNRSLFLGFFDGGSFTHFLMFKNPVSCKFSATLIALSQILVRGLRRIQSVQIVTFRWDFDVWLV